jgi:hypothetical protein
MNHNEGDRSETWPNVDLDQQGAFDWRDRWEGRGIDERGVYIGDPDGDLESLGDGHDHRVVRLDSVGLDLDAQQTRGQVHLFERAKRGREKTTINAPVPHRSLARSSSHPRKG